MRRKVVMGETRDLGVVALVSGLSSAYAAVLLMASASLEALAPGDGGAKAALSVVSTVFVGIALYVAVLVMTNCVATVLAGRQRHLALLRLLGAGSRELREAVVRSTAITGLVGAALGVVAGTVITDVARAVLVTRGTFPRADYPVVAPSLLVALAAVTAAALLAGWWGSATVLRAAPAQAMTGALGGAPEERLLVSRVRTVVAVALGLVGVALLVLACVVAEGRSEMGFLWAFAGSVLSGTGVLIGARRVVPAAVSVLGRGVGSGAAGRIARRNAVADPLRTTRSTMGLVLGVALVTTFASGTAALQASLVRWDLTPEEAVQARGFLTVASSIMIGIVVVSAVLSAVGFVSTMSLTVLQRRREIGLLRALGFTTQQVRTMITREAVALTGTAVTVGITLGLVYGAVGAQSLVGSLTPGFVLGLPWIALGVIAVSCVVLVLVSSQAPARRAVTVSPVEALRVVD